VIREEFVTNSPEETEALGRRLGTLLQPGDFLALHGDLGGGKTCFTRGVVQALAPESAHLVASPTFAIMNQYPGSLPVYHFDFYRLATEDDIVGLGFMEYLESEGVCVVEWPERLESLLPSAYLLVSFHYDGENSRRITIEARGASPENISSRIQHRIR